MDTAHDICAAMRSSPANSHDNMRDVLACFAAMVGRPMNELSDRATRVVVDLIDEISGVVENDQIEQQQETTWYHREDVPACAGTWAQLDALTIRAAA